MKGNKKTNEAHVLGKTERDASGEWTLRTQTGCWPESADQHADCCHARGESDHAGAESLTIPESAFAKNAAAEC